MIPRSIFSREISVQKFNFIEKIGVFYVKQVKILLNTPYFQLFFIETNLKGHF